METVYIETSIVSLLVANPSRDPILAAHQQLTRQWWLRALMAARGLALPEICTPIELGGQ